MAQARRRADAALVLVPGIGRHRHGSLLERMGKPCLEAIECLVGVQGYEARTIDDLDPVTSGPRRRDSPRSSLVTLHARR